MLDKVKNVLRITSAIYDSQLTDMIEEAKADLEMADAVIDTDRPAVRRAILTYCRLHFGNVTDGEYARLERSYNEQKAQLQTSTKHNGRGEYTDDTSDSDHSDQG